MDLYYPAPKRHFPHWAALNDDPPLEYKPPAPAPAPRITLAGSLDPTTGIFYRTPEHPRLRTAQACEKCRTRKAKCSGDHPACSRCVGRGLQCEYAKEGRVRGPNKTKSRANSTASSHPSPLSHTPAPLPPYGNESLVNINVKRRRRATTMSSSSPGSGVKLEPLSSCLPLALPSSHSHHGGLDLPLAVSKRFSLPASLSTSSSGHGLPSSSSNTLHPLPLHTLSSGYDYHGDGYAESSGYADSTYTDSRRGSFDPHYAPDVKVEAYDDDAGYGHGHEARAYYETPSAAFHLEPGYAVQHEHDFASDLARTSSGRSMSMSGRSDSVSSGASSGPASGVSGSFPLFRATYSDRYSPPQQDAYTSSPAHSHYQTPPHSASALSFHSAHSGSSYHSPASHVSSPYASRPHSAYGEQHVEGYSDVEERMHYDQSAVYGGQPEPMGYVDEYEHPVYQQEQQQHYTQSHASVYGDEGMDVDGGGSSTGLNVSALRGWVEPSSMPMPLSSSSSSSLSSPHTHSTLAQPHPQLSVRIPSVPSLSRVPSSSGYPSSTRRSLTLTTEPLSPLSASGSMGGIPLSAASSSSSLAGSGMGASASMGLVRTLSDTGGSPTRGSEGVARARARAATVSGFGGL